MTNTNALLVSLFSPAQIVAMALVAVLLALLIGLNLYMMYLNHKRGEHKMHTKQLQQQRDALMDKLVALRDGTYVHESDAEGNGEGKSVALVEEEVDTRDDDDFVGESEESEEQEAEIEIDESGKVIRYNRSFTARVIQSTDDVKTRYSELKNYLLSFENVRARISWRHELFSIGKRTIAKFNMRGKTLCLCLATDPKLFDGTKYLVDDLSVRNKKNPMPCMYRIKSELRMRYAKDLIDVVMAGFNTVRKETYESTDFVMPYEATQVLIKRKLIKQVGDELSDIEREEALASSEGIRYNRSFEANLRQSSDMIKTAYTKLKNYLLAHSGMSAQINWQYESFRRGKSEIAALTMSGKDLCLCIAGDPKKLQGSKFKTEDLSAKNPETSVPVLYRIRTSHSLVVAQQLIDRQFGELGISKVERMEESYDLSFMSTSALVEKGLVKVIEGEKSVPYTRQEEHAAPVIEAPAVGLLPEANKEEPKAEEPKEETKAEEPKKETKKKSHEAPKAE
ncbi:MAG: hypothetical protein K2L87_01830 [Clostridiales bacterium]|nr:hypothetical protein [Clostridiales bacterium]